MTVPFSGRPPIVAVPSPNHPQINPTTPNADAIKGVLVARLAATAGQQSASEQLNESEFRLVDDELLIKTNLSRTMLPVVLNADAERTMKVTLQEYGVSGIRIKLLPSAPVSAKATRDTPRSAATIDASFKRLANSALKLNEISNKLAKQVEQIDLALKRLNLGVTAWVTIRREEDEDGHYLGEQVGYTRYGNRWCVVLRTFSGMEADPSGPDENVWAFTDAPRQLRIRATEHIPKLLESLCHEADEMVKQLTPRVEDLENVTSALISSGGAR
jgi:hypothetical protein